MKNFVNKKIFFMAVIFSVFTLNTSACVVVIIGGAQAFTETALAPVANLLGYEFNEDIAVRLFKEYRSEAQRSGCTVEIIPDTNKENFKRRLTAIAKYAAIKKENVQFSFTDHGSPSNPQSALSNVSDLIVGSEENGRMLNTEFVKLLKDIFKDGQRITFATNNCYSQMSELVVEADLDSSFDICGGGSTHYDYMSYNLSKSTDINGKKVGSFLGKGLESHIENVKKSNTPVSVFEFQNAGRFADFGNSLLMPGYNTSVAFARKVLKNKKIRAVIDDNPLGNIMNDIQSPNSIFESVRHMNLTEEINRLTYVFEKMQKGVVKPCKNESKNPIDNIVSNFGSLYKRLMFENLKNIPSPYSERTKASMDWIKSNNSGIAKKVINAIKKKNDFMAKFKDKIEASKKNPKLYREIEEEWSDVKREITADFMELSYHMRNLQEASTINQFLSVASVKEKDRFKKFISCEAKPMYK